MRCDLLSSHKNKLPPRPRAHPVAVRRLATDIHRKGACVASRVAVVRMVLKLVNSPSATTNMPTKALPSRSITRHCAFKNLFTPAGTGALVTVMVAQCPRVSASGSHNSSMPSAFQSTMSALPPETRHVHCTRRCLVWAKANGRYSARNNIPPETTNQVLRPLWRLQPDSSGKRANGKKPRYKYVFGADSYAFLLGISARPAPMSSQNVL